MKKNCLNCKSYDQSFQTCTLGFKQEYVYVNELIRYLKPLEECPKPKTYMQLVKESNRKGK